MPTKTIDLGFRPREWQAEVYRRLKRFNVLVVHRRGGKTVLAVMLIIDRALKMNRKDGRFAYVAPLFVQAKAVAWDYLKNFCRPIPGCKVNESECYVELPNGSRIRIYGADDPDRMRGLYFDGVVLDELADMKPSVWGEVVRPALADKKGWCLFIGTPKGVNLLSEMFYGADGKEDWYAARLTVNDTDALDSDEVSAARESMSESQFAQEFLCDFAAGNANALLSVTEVEAAVARHYMPDEFPTSPRIIGVDVARQGTDKTVIAKVQGLICHQLISRRGADGMEVAALVASEITKWHPDAVFIDGTGGYGAGVVDRLRQLGHQCVDVQFGGAADDPRFINKRTEMWWRMAEWIKRGAMLPNDPELKRDLCAPTYNHKNAKGRLALESKDDIKKRGLPSPDGGDAVALCHAYDVAPRGMNGRLSTALTKAKTEWDPYADA